MFNITIQNCKFSNNTGAFSKFEALDEIWQNRTLNFYPLENCTEEFEYIGKCQNSTMGIKFPMSKGAIYIEKAENITIKNSSFVNNDPGPVMELDQRHGRLKRSSSIYQEISANLSIESCTFRNNSAHWVD